MNIAVQYKDVVENSLCGGDVTLETFKSRSRQPDISFARFRAWIILHIEYRLSYAAIGRLYNKNHTTIRHGVNKIAHLHSDIYIPSE